ncbi:hypothetical protein EW026_g6534 [Hermanssonia centrifuga]|uniref:Uncharacterized protein n=1 Tax=Hermanssonia centrifuga TaxID=98765 RepID=A0A4S4KAQ7_9APHY|nr:hypothetical protein EW026_g6534 [Hermanssonia centrifuga]
MSLVTGNYIITSKKVVSLPAGVQPPVWAVQLLDNGKYILKIGGAATAEFENNVFAILLDVPIPTEWVITAVPQHGPNVYIIENGDRSAGWVIPEEEAYTQVAVKPLTATKSFPPQYLPNEQYYIVPAE